jgi:phenylacetate-CoA ligase
MKRAICFGVKMVKKILKQISNIKIIIERKKAMAEANRVFILLNRMQYHQYQDLATYRNKKLLEILEYANKHCNYYRNIFNKYHFNPKELYNFRKLPLLNKSTIKTHLKDIISDEKEKLVFHMFNTGGSTGEPLEFPVSTYDAGFIDRVHQKFLYNIIGYTHGDKIFAFGGCSVPEASRRRNIYWVEKASGDIPYGRIIYSALYLTRETMPYYIEHLLQQKPCILRGYPSCINDISTYILENNISIPFSIKGIELTAENTYHWQIENIRKAFGTKIFFQYGHSEVSVFAYTVDETYEFHCSPFYGLVEVLNSEGLPAEPGETGEVVVTGFYNRVLPFIRYQTGDIALFNGEENGIVKLGKIVGRAQDYIYSKNNERVALTALVFGQHYHAFSNMQKWQLQQDIPGKVKINIIRADAFSKNDEGEIKNKFKNICNVDADIRYVESLPLTQRGKFKFLIQNIRG